MKGKKTNPAPEQVRYGAGPSPEQVRYGAGPSPEQVRYGAGPEPEQSSVRGKPRTRASTVRGKPRTRASTVRGKQKIKKKITETDIQKIVNHYFYTKGLSLEKIKSDAKKKKIIYSRFTRPAKQLLELAGSVKKSKDAIDKVAQWAQSRGLDYAIETVFKKWLELDRLKPKEIVKKPFYQGNSMVWSQTKKKWYVITDEGDWREFVGDEKDIIWKMTMSKRS